MAERLGSAVLELDVDLSRLERNLKIADERSDETGEHFKRLQREAAFAERGIKQIKMLASQSRETGLNADLIESAIRGIRDRAREAEGALDDVKLSEEQAAETEVASSRMQRSINAVTRHANEARRALLSMRLAGAGAGGGGRVPVSARNPGAGFGPFGSGFGRIGLLGAAVGGAALLTPAAGPATLGLLAAIPTLAAGGAGALGTLALAFAGVGKAINGDLKAFKKLQPAQQDFVLTVRSLTGWLNRLRELAGESLFPGLTRGLKAALSPGTLGVITTAVQQFGQAIGQAGEQWGKYFGSAEFQNLFGPLMTAAARTLTTLSGAALSLFDALGVLGRAGIPLTSWLLDAAARGANLVDTFVRAKDASGGLAGAMGEAQTSLRLVAGLGESLLRVVGALGQALYPVSQIAVKDLTDGLNGLAGIIDRNQAKIQEIVGGALAALRSTVETVTPIIGAMATALDKVAEAVGGWKTAFQLILGGYLAKSFLNIAVAAGGEKGAAGGVAKLGGMLDRLRMVGGVTLGIDVLVNAKEQSTGQVLTKGAIAGFLFGGPVGAGVGTLAALGYKTFQGDPTAGQVPGAGGLPKGTPAEAAYLRGLKLAKAGRFNEIAKLTRGDDTVTAKSSGYFGVTAQAPTGKGAGKFYGDQFFAAGVAAGRKAAQQQKSQRDQKSMFDDLSYIDYSAGYPFDKNLGSRSAAAAPLPFRDLARVSATTAQLRAAVYAATHAREQTAAAAGAASLTATARQTLTDLRKQQQTHAGAQAARLLGVGPGPSTPTLLRSLQTRQRSLLARTLETHGMHAPAGMSVSGLLARASGVLTAVQRRSLDAVNKALTIGLHEKFLPPEAIANIKQRLDQFNDTVTGSFDKLNTTADQVARKNEQAFLRMFAALQNRYGPNSAPTAGDGGGVVATHLYDIKHETRRQTRVVERATMRGGMPAGDYATKLALLG